MGGSEWATSTRASVVCRLLWARGKFSFRLKRNIFPFILSRTWIRGLGHNKRLSDINSFNPWIGHGKQSVLIILQWAFEVPKVHYLIPSCSECLNSPFYPWISQVHGVPIHMHVLNLVIFLLQAKKAANKVTLLNAFVSFHDARFNEWNLSRWTS